MGMTSYTSGNSEGDALKHINVMLAEVQWTFRGLIYKEFILAFPSGLYSWQLGHHLQTPAMIWHDTIAYLTRDAMHSEINNRADTSAKEGYTIEPFKDIHTTMQT